MPLTATEIRDKLRTHVTVTIPDLGDVRCFRPDVADLMLRGELPLPTLGAVVREMNGDPTDPSTDRGVHTADLLDRWAVMVCRSPRVVATEAESGPDALWVSELPLGAKTMIFRATFEMSAVGRQAAAAEFREEPTGHPAGPGGAPVSDAPLDDVGNSRSGRRARLRSGPRDLERRA